MASEFFAAPKLRRSQQVDLALFCLAMQAGEQSGNYQTVIDFMLIPTNRTEIYNLSGALNTYAGQAGQPPDNYPQDPQVPITKTGERRSGEDGAPFLNPRAITVVPVDVANTGPFKFRVADFPSADFKRVTLSHEPGNLETPIAISSNGTNVAVELPSIAPGRYYANIVFWNYFGNEPSGPDVPQGVVMSVELP